MQPSHALSSARRTCLFAAIPWASLCLQAATPAMAQTIIPLAPFRSVTLRGGGEVILRHASTQRVTLLKGSTVYTGVTIAEDGRLVIDRCQTDCPRGYEVAVEVLTPEIDDLMVMDGGTIQCRGSFPRQAEIEVGVGDGGTIDLRSMTVDWVAAAVHDGGRVFTKPKKALVARIARGGVVTYWGSPRVTSSVEQGGIVARGAAADADKSLRALGPEDPVVPPLPVLPPVPPIGGRKTF